MTDSSGRVDAAIEKIVRTYQEMADEERSLAPRREAAKQRIEQLVDDLAGLDMAAVKEIDADMLAAYYLFEKMMEVRAQLGDAAAQMTFAKFSEDVKNRIKQEFSEIPNDPARIMALQNSLGELTEDLQPPKVQRGMPTFEIAICEPDEDYGTWTAAVFPVVVNDDYRVEIPETLNFDLYLSAEFTPHEGLQSAFNIPGRRFAAGEKIEPFIASHETHAGGPQTVLHVRGHIYGKDGSYTQPLDFPRFVMAKRQPGQEPGGLDMEALMRALGGGSGPAGPN